jgi:hypothetical protein
MYFSDATGLTSLSKRDCANIPGLTSSRQWEHDVIVLTSARTSRWIDPCGQVRVILETDAQGNYDRTFKHHCPHIKRRIWLNIDVLLFALNRAVQPYNLKIDDDKHLHTATNLGVAPPSYISVFHKSYLCTKSLIPYFISAHSFWLTNNISNVKSLYNVTID